MIVRAFLMLVMALVVTMLLLIAAHVTALPAAATVEPARPEIGARPEINRLAASEAETPCMRVPSGTIWSRWVTWTIRAADGTVISVGAVDVRQRC